MNRFLFNVLITELKKLDKDMILDVWLDKDNHLGNVRFSDISLCRFGYNRVKYFEVSYNPTLKRHTAYVELENVC